jgi:hypothetical protein
MKSSSGSLWRYDPNSFHVYEVREEGWRSLVKMASDDKFNDLRLVVVGQGRIFGAPRHRPIKMVASLHQALKSGCDFRARYELQFHSAAPSTT